jgi:hypothetical protein
MKHKIVPIFVMLTLVTSWLIGCTAATETLPPTATKPALPTSTGEPVEFVTGAPNTPTVVRAPTTKPPTATPTSPPTLGALTDTPVPEEAEPEPAVLKGRIVFPVFDAEAGTYNVYLARPDGGDRTLVAAEASQPTLNSDGGRVAFRSWAQNRGLFERGLEGDGEWQFNTFGEAARPAFSPDDQSFLFQSREGGEEFAIYRTVDREYEVLRREAFPVQGEAPAWTADGESLIYRGCLGERCGLYKINIDGSSPQQLTENLSDTNPAVSPDGETIALMAQDYDENWDIYTIGIGGSGRKQLTTDPAPDGLPTWSPDGQSIAFVSERSGEWAVWAMDADGNNQRLLFELGGSIDGVVQVDVQNSNGWLEESIDWAP